MKKILSLILSLLLILSLCACGSTNEIDQDLQELENIFSSVSDKAQDLIDQVGSAQETLPDFGETIESVSEDAEDLFHKVEDQLATTAATEVPVEPLPLVTDPTETAPVETEEDELPIETFSEAYSPIDEDGSYTTAEDVALYIHTYGKLPQNFITKSEARALGWEGGSLEPYAPGKCIGGDRFGNYEGLLPTDRKYTECDIDTLGASSRGAKRIVFSNDGLIYYTEDHYESFTLLYGEE